MSPSTKPSVGLAILVVDDNREAAITLALLLKLTGYQTHSCYSGQEALEAADGLHPDVILLDLAMPGLDGFETARLLRLKSGQPHLLIALTGYSQEDDRGRAEKAGFDGFLVKPVDLAALTRLLTKAKPSADSDQVG